jgi:hypothetical protein
MSDFNIYIRLPRYLREWAVFHFGSPCRFPSQSPINAVIRHFVRLRPSDLPVERCATDQISVCIPDSRAKPPISYNYINQYGQEAVAESINDLFTTQMYEELHDITHRGVRLSTIIYDWLTANGIDLDEYVNVRQKFYRIIESYKKAGVDISRHDKKK